MKNTKPFYKSRTIWGAIAVLAAVLPELVAALEVVPDLPPAVADWMPWLAVAGAIASAYGRVAASERVGL